MATFLNFLCHPTFYVLPPLLQVFLEAESVVVAEPEVFALVSVAAELSPEIVVLVVEPEVVFVAAELSPEVVVSVAAELSPEVVFWVVEPEVSEPGVVFVAVVFVGVAELQASVDIVVVFVVLVPVSVVVVEVDSSGRPKFFAFPNICSFPNCSSSVEVVG
jgi:hypothetical protein